MMLIVLYSYIYFIIISNATPAKFFPVLNLPDIDVPVDVDRGFILERTGVYSTNLDNIILHTVIPLHDLCQASPTIDICMRPTSSKEDNMIELETIMAPKQNSFFRSRYNKNDVAKIVNKNLNDFG
ncbi:unnamed protein product [Rotaria magnacalcarata]|uniref:Uncharacterized protein n=1 Tax=Rotaria magnacalcarata TaxID=392030 RepID=A0A814XY10_9BILA|nr:unnamed protein product [Rotaria magnacalcarata]